MQQHTQLPDPQLHQAVQDNDPIEVKRILKQKPRIIASTLIAACEHADLQCFSLLFPCAKNDQHLQVLEHLVVKNNISAVQVCTQFKVKTSIWNHVLWSACQHQNQDMVDVLHSKANSEEVKEMFEELEYTADEPAYLILIEHEQRQQLKEKLTQETKHQGSHSSKSKI